MVQSGKRAGRQKCESYRRQAEGIFRRRQYRGKEERMLAEEERQEEEVRKRKV